MNVNKKYPFFRYADELGNIEGGGSTDFSVGVEGSLDEAIIAINTLKLGKEFVTEKIATLSSISIPSTLDITDGDFTNGIACLRSSVSAYDSAIETATNVRNKYLIAEGIDPELFEEYINQLSENFADDVIDSENIFEELWGSSKDSVVSGGKSLLQSFFDSRWKADHPFRSTVLAGTVISILADWAKGKEISLGNVAGSSISSLEKYGTGALKSYILTLIGKTSDVLELVTSKSFKKSVRAGLDNGVKKDVTTKAVFNAGVIELSRAVMKELPIVSVLDYVTTQATTITKSLFDGKTIGEAVSLENAKSGSNFLKATVRGVCSVAGSAVGHLIAGCAAGAVLAEVSVAPFKDENTRKEEAWCAAAGAATLAGGIGGAAAGAAIVTACAVTGPVGWVVGGCLLAGAAIGYVGTVVAHGIAEKVEEKKENNDEPGFFGRLFSKKSD